MFRNKFLPPAHSALLIVRVHWNDIDILRSYFFQEIVSRHALAGSLRLESKAALMPQIGLCAKKTLHSKACHLSRCMPKSKHVLCIRAVRVGPKSRFASLLASFTGYVLLLCT